MAALKINFILPVFPPTASGGPKIMYEYASRLALKGYDVIIYHSLNTSYLKYRFPFWARKIKHAARALISPAPGWFTFPKQVVCKTIPEVTDQYIRNSDITISTWWATALEVSRLSASKGKKFNLIQGYETWTGHTELVHQSYKLPGITNIVISTYLSQLVTGISGQEPVWIPNSVDFSKLGIDVEPEQRDAHSVMMLYSTEPIKGSEYGIKALERVKKEIPELKVTLFGVYKPPVSLAPYITYHQSPRNLRVLYNQSSIFLAPSISEGWGLPSCEAMSCGCAVVCTDIPGHLDYAKDIETALLVKTQDADAMAEKVIKLIRQREQRIGIAERGSVFIRQFTWEKAIQKMENLF